MQWGMSSASSVEGGIKCLVYSDAGIGKTVLTATAPAPLLISAESGTLSLRKKNLERLYGVNTPGITYDIPCIFIQGMKDLNDAYQWCASSAEAKQFQTICLDSISEIGEVVLANAKLGVKDPRQAYGELLNQMTTLIRCFRDLNGKHVYMAAKMETMKDEMTGAVKYGPSFPGAKLGPQSSYFFDEVWKLSTGMTAAQGNKPAESYRYLQTQPDMQNVAKDRSGSLAPVIAPHLGHAFSTILGD